MSIDLSGQRYGKLIVIEKSRPYKTGRIWYYNCKCDCGKTKEILSNSLKHGSTKSCGCLRKGINRKYKDGDIFNNIQIIKSWIISHKNRRYQCKCLLCNSEFEVQGTKNLSNKQDCGCQTPNRYQSIHKDIIGKRCGKLVAIKWLRTEKGKNPKNSNNIWLCQCDCGRQSEISRSNFRPDITESCGKCLKEDRTKIPNYLLSNIIKGAESRNLEYNVDSVFLMNLFLDQKEKCKLSGRKIYFNTKSKENTASLDRIDSSKGYTKDNVQWIHKDINIIKNRFGQDYFLTLCKEIYHNNQDNIKPIDVPSWTDYFLGIACLVAQRSKDAQTKCGCVLVDHYNHIIGTGYNSFPKGFPDEIAPNIRPAKYDLMVHAELQALINTTVDKFSIQEGIAAYITMPPCYDCLTHMVNSNVKRIFAIDQSVSTETNKNNDYFHVLINSANIDYILIKPDLKWINNIYDFTIKNKI